MVASLLTAETPSADFAELLRPEPLPDGTEPEERLILCGLSWQRYLDIDKAMGDDRSGPRFYYLDGDLEIMTTSNEHERIKKWIAGFMDIYFDHLGIEIMPRGQATMRLALKAAGAEPDESWCIGEEKEFPDLVLEIALTSGGVSKLELYRRFHVPEVWFWRSGGLRIFTLREDGSGYDQVSRSRLLPELDPALLEHCVGIASWQEARREFRARLASGQKPSTQP
jgi:Uma2 family endonuclease